MPSPTVMVSSTFYDLRQIRTDLAEFLSGDLGYTSLLSEFPSFPIDPDKDTIENCCKRVEENADILVLVVGGRYGSVDEKTDKSITNLEYLTGRRKRIPIYTFVDKQVLSLLPFWKRNPEADYSNVVDTTKLFEFVEEVRTKEGVWTFPFETAQDIIATLKIQLAYLFYDSLRVRHRLAGAGLPAFSLDLSSEALKLILEKPAAWEYMLFFQVWLDEVERRANLVREFEAGLTIGASEAVEAEMAPGWFQTRLQELQGLINSANHLISVSAQKAFGDPGHPGDPEAIVWTAKKLGDALQAAVNWSLHIRRARVAEPFARVALEMSKFPAAAIERLRHFPAESLPWIKSALAETSGGPPQKRTLTFTLEISNEKGFEEAMAEAERRYAAGDY